MAGIYVHIPFCHQRCHYCDFYKVVNDKLIDPFLLALQQELVLRRHYLNGEVVNTIYFGGGTPSLLSADNISELLISFAKYYNISPEAEITLEANPDDLNIPYLRSVKHAGINRLSIGIQSFNDDHLSRMNRRHNSAQAVQAVYDAYSVGFHNLSADLIYGLPKLTTEVWEYSLKELFKLPVNHLSAYHLTYHKGTVFYKWLSEKKIIELTEDESLKQFATLMDLSEEAGFYQYEISNFAKDGYISKHNSAYWSGDLYLGLGPSAHSFNGTHRSWNHANVKKYIENISNGNCRGEEEVLTEKNRFNEYLITRLRTRQGVNIEEIGNIFGQEYENHLKIRAESFITGDKMMISNGFLKFTRSGLFISDTILADFIVV